MKRREFIKQMEIHGLAILAPISIGNSKLALNKNSYNKKSGISMFIKSFSLKNVTLFKSPFKDAQDRAKKYLHELDADRLLHRIH